LLKGEGLLHRCTQFALCAQRERAAEMFQPAGVRTLLHMRSSDPVRPATATARAAAVRCSTPNLGASVGAGGFARGTPSGEQEPPRPLTAPACAGHAPFAALTRSTSGVAPEAVDERESEVEAQEEEAEEEDPRAVLDEASTMLYQLQNGWAEERRQELSRLARQLEEEYGVSAPAEDEQEALWMMDFRNSADGAAPSSPTGGSSKVLEACVADPEDETCEADAMVDAAARQLEAVRLRLLRRQEQQRQGTLAIPSSPSRSAAAAGAADRATRAAAPAGGREADADEERMAGLRQELELLRAREREPQAPLSPAPASDAVDVNGAPVPSVGLGSGHVGSELTALNEWLEDMRLLVGSGGSAAGSLPRSPASASAGVGVLRSPVSPSGARSPAAPLSPSKREMARMAEERAMEWASGGQARGSSRKRVDGAKGSLGAVLSPALCGVSPRKSLGSRPPASPMAVASPPPGGPRREKLAVEVELDAILGELDEIDRIHDGICRLTCES